MKIYSAEARARYVEWLGQMGTPNAERIVAAAEAAGIEYGQAISLLDTRSRKIGFDPEKRGEPFKPYLILTADERELVDSFLEICAVINGPLVDKPKNGGTRQ